MEGDGRAQQPAGAGHLQPRPPPCVGKPAAHDQSAEDVHGSRAEASEEDKGEAVCAVLNEVAHVFKGGEAQGYGDGGGDAEDAAGQADNEHEKPCDDGQRRKDGRKEDFQKETHINIHPVLFVSAFSIQEAALPCKDAGPQKKAGAAYLAASRPAWDKYPIILWWQAGKRIPLAACHIRS